MILWIQHFMHLQQNAMSEEETSVSRTLHKESGYNTGGSECAGVYEIRAQKCIEMLPRREDYCAVQRTAHLEIQRVIYYDKIQV